MKSEPELLFEKHLAELGLEFRREWRFHPTRRWRFDFALGLSYSEGRFEPNRIAIEIEGGIYTQGRHTRGKGFQADLDKYNHATAMGWRVFRFSTRDVLRGRAKDFLKAQVQRYWSAEML